MVDRPDANGPPEAERAPPDWVPPICICETSPRRVRKIVRTVGLLFLTAGLAAYLSHCVQNEYNNNALENVQGGLARIENKVEMIMHLLKVMVNRQEDGIKGGLSPEMVEEIKNIVQGQLRLYDSDKTGHADYALGNLGGLSPEMVEETKNIVQGQLRLYDSDKTGRTDYALGNLGGCILTTRGTPTYKEGAPTVSILGIPVMTLATDPKAIIQANVLPGECWAICGTRGTVVIQLVDYINVTHVSIEHIPAALSPTGDITSAPKKVALYGLLCVDDPDPHHFGFFTYNKTGTPLQTWAVENPSNTQYDIVELTIHSNHGNPHFTCLYRVRIHGIPAERSSSFLSRAK